MLNTKELIENLTGKNKAFIKRVDKQQRERYGNEDVFDALLSTHNKGTYFESTTIDMHFGENHIEFTFNTKGEVVNTYGNGQGHKRLTNLTAVKRHVSLTMTTTHVCT